MPTLSEVLDETANAKTSIELLEKFVKYARRLLTKKRQKELIDLMFREILKGEAGDMDAATSAMKELQKLGVSSGDFEKAQRYLLLTKISPRGKMVSAKKAAPAKKATAANKQAARKAAAKVAANQRQFSAGRDEASQETPPK